VPGACPYALVPVPIRQLIENKLELQQYGEMSDDTNNAQAADEHSASHAYRSRFAGASGAWLLEVQGSAIRTVLAGVGVLPGQAALDVGGGHGQCAPLLRDLGYQVTVLGSNERSFTQINDPHIARVISPLTALQVGDRSYALVNSFRILPHVDEWQLFIAEICRVSAGLVMVDVPLRVSINAIAPLLFSWKKRLEKNTRPYTLFSLSEIRREFLRHGFEIIGIERQFFWPMALHRMVGSPKISAALEGVAQCLGLRRNLGSPAVILARRIPT
jgi:2-polyprenyl-3-methyl-5-hydroxy-6-metoxy-1,4-benzoquinol methylase